MRSYDALHLAIGGHTFDHAKALRLSMSMVGKWQEPANDFTDSGAYNPLDRIETIVQTALTLGKVSHEEALAPIQYLNERFNIIGIQMPTCPEDINTVQKALLKTAKEFGDLMSTSAQCLEDGSLKRKERERISKEGWELIRQAAIYLKSIEACEGKLR